jgi:outer membrane protein OmpA-like peptidoglycan-associated protein
LVEEPGVLPPPQPPKAEPIIINKQEVKKGSVLVFDNIFYDYNSHDIKQGSAAELDQLVAAMVSNPSIKVQLSSHTDSRGESLYNQILSDKRAESAKSYLVNRGISESRVVAIGFGESRIRNRCEDGVKCTEEEHQFNRRTEVKIVEY